MDENEELRGMAIGIIKVDGTYTTLFFGGFEQGCRAAKKRLWGLHQKGEIGLRTYLGAMKVIRALQKKDRREP